MKEMIRRYPDRIGKSLDGVAAREFDAVKSAVEKTVAKPNGEHRLRLIDMVFWKRSHNIPGAAMQIPCSERTAQRWHADFIREVAKNFSLLD